MSFLDFDDKSSKSSSFLLSELAPLPDKDSKSSTDAADARDAADEETLLAEFKKNPESAKRLVESYVSAAQAPRQTMTRITPIAGLVIQTKTAKQCHNVPMDNPKLTAFPKDTDVFINICYSDQMPKPTAASEAEIKKAIIAEKGAVYQVPFSISQPREYKDAVSKSYLVVDACIHAEPFQRISTGNPDYALYIYELALEWVEEKCRLELSRDVKFPSMRSKDELKARPVILPKPPAIQEVETGNKSAAAAKATDTAAKSKQTMIHVPVAGKDDYIPKSRLLPCPKGTLGIIVEVDLPSHKNMDGVTLDVVLPDKLVLHSKSQGKSADNGKEYHLEVELPNEPVDLDAIKAEFNKAKRTLRVYTIKQKRK
ncbi:pre-RNA processing PIH1/Nop17-domain-containing protein [Gamsiella multidivaricata]|uniref:pre-RNA processing PIH1/Nop17-domain-containing protein n=1 Tax=Gamsiella multidivaricata TaxID=101098 RepID=UPI00221FBA47|nr:pre-RNA processing PIH1/Nop17-domain-containing protein [Gamsiella multidivaricata]KAI7815978.1 pre-RNA processing PIH1/Nop17-domain-containing protein [Gamsiella multidivaricata]